MSWDVAIIVISMVAWNAECAPSPFQLTIDCGSEERDTNYLRPRFPNLPGKSGVNVDSLCNLIHRAIPKAVKDGKFTPLEPAALDQIGFSDSQSPIAIPPPKGFLLNLPKFRTPKLKVPKINVPKLEIPIHRPRTAPKVGISSIMNFRAKEADNSSVERMEKFKKGVQKMLHVVKVLGQIDQYLSERTRIVVQKLTKTLAE